MCHPKLVKRVGNHATFAVEFELTHTAPSKWNEWYGSIWLWAGARQLGNPFETEMVAIALDSLTDTARETGTRHNSIIPVESAEQILEIVMSACYGNTDGRISSLVRDEERLHPFEILPRRTGPSFDGWEAVLVEYDDTERFIFREEKGEVRELSWPLGTYREVVLRANHEFQSFTQALLKRPS
jgi:hypothetical protein